MAERPEDLNLPNSVVARIIKDVVGQITHIHVYADTLNAHVAIELISTTFKHLDHMKIISSACDRTFEFSSIYCSYLKESMFQRMPDLQYPKLPACLFCMQLPGKMCHLKLHMSYRS